MAVYVPTNHLYLGDIVVVSARRWCTIRTLSVEDGIRIFLTGGMALPDRHFAAAATRRECRMRSCNEDENMLTRLSEHVMWRRAAGVAALALTLAMMAAPAALAAQQPARPAGEHRPGGEVNIQLPDLNQGDFLGMTGHQILLTGPGGLRARPALRRLDLHRGEEPAGAQVDGRRLGAHLRDVQGLPDAAGQVPADPRALHRRDHGRLLRADRPRGLHASPSS